jgi:hypothetical protein
MRYSVLQTLRAYGLSRPGEADESAAAAALARFALSAAERGSASLETGGGEHEAQKPGNPLSAVTKPPLATSRFDSSGDSRPDSFCGAQPVDPPLPLTVPVVFDHTLLVGQLYPGGLPAAGLSSSDEPPARGRRATSSRMTRGRD